MFKHRSHQKELLDGDAIPEADLILNLRELDTINHLLGGYRITFAGLRQLLKPGQHYTLVDIGCGGGDTLKRIHAWKTKRGLDVDLVGVDIKDVCVNYARTHTAGTPITFICDDYRNCFHHMAHADILHACLFCHHLSEEELLGLIRFSLANGCTLLINDLERNPIAYYAIKWLTAFCSKSYLVKNDAPLSVSRGFKKREWIALLQQAGASRYSVKSQWAFRHQVIVYAN